MYSVPLRSFKSYRSGELVRKRGKECMGTPLYRNHFDKVKLFLSMKRTTSSTRKMIFPFEDEVKTVFEIRLKMSVPIMQSVIYSSGDNPEYVPPFKIINRYIRFVDKDDSNPF